MLAKSEKIANFAPASRLLKSETGHREGCRHIYRKRFVLYPLTENRQFSTREGQSSQENAHACRLSTPRQGVSIER